MATVLRVKHSKQIQQAIRAAMFEGYEDVNMVEMDGDYYWTVSYSEMANGEVRYVLDYAAPTSLVRLGDTLTGEWHKTAGNYCGYLKNAITNAPKLVSKTVALPRIVDKDADTYNLGKYWVQVCGYDNQGKILRRGWFTSLTTGNGILKSAAGTTHDGATADAFPSLYHVIANMQSATGILAEEVLDFSISARCPFGYTTVKIGTTWCYVIEDHAHAPSYPTLTTTEGGTTRYMYDLDALPDLQLLGNEESISITLSNMESAIGDVSLRDSDWNNIGTFATMGDGNCVFLVRTFSDLNGIYTTVSYVINSEKVQQVTFMEGKLPYLGNTAETYRAYQMDTDRLSMENSINYNEIQRQIDLKVGLTNAAVHGIEAALTGAAGSSLLNLGAPAVAGAAMGAGISLLESGLSLYETQATADLKNMQARDTAALSEKQAISQPQTAYQSGYGTIYAVNQYMRPPAITLAMPYGIDEGYYEDAVEDFGYPAEGRIAVTIRRGFWQGQLLNDGTITGQRFDELNKDFMRGFKFLQAGLPVYDAVLTGTGMDIGYGTITWKERKGIKVNDVQYTIAISSNHWVGNGFQGTIMRSDMDRYAGFRWGQASGTVDLDSFGYCRYYYIAGRLFANDDYTAENTYVELTGSAKDTVLALYKPRLYPEDADLTDYMINHPFHSLTAER